MYTWQKYFIIIFVLIVQITYKTGPLVCMLTFIVLVKCIANGKNNNSGMYPDVPTLFYTYLGYIK